MVAAVAVRLAGSHQRHHCDDAAGLDVNAVIVPILAKKNVIVIMCKGRGKLAQGVAASEAVRLAKK